MSNFQPNFLFLPYEILSDDRLSLRQIRVLMAILSWRKKNTNLSRISREMISERTGYPLTRVSNITTQLEKLGWISKKGNGGKSQWCEYTIKDVEKLIAHKSNGDQNGNHDQNGNDTVTESVIPGVTNSDTGIDTGISTDKGQIFYKKIDISTFDEHDQNIARKVIDYRLSMKKPLKSIKGVTGRIGEVKECMKAHNISLDEVMHEWETGEWMTIGKDYNCFDKYNKELSLEELIEQRRKEAV